MKWSWLTVGLIGLQIAAAATLASQGPPRDQRPPMHAAEGRGRPMDDQRDPLAHYLFAPELVMQHQGELGLQDSQRATIQAAMKEAQAAVMDTQWKLTAEAEKLGRLLAEDRIDETRALQQVDRVLALEREMKRAQMTLMIRLKNALTPAQQDKLRQLRQPEGDG